MHCGHGCESETTLICVMLCTLIVMCMVAIIAEAVDDLVVHVHREVADVVEGDLARAQVERVEVAVARNKN